jgi:hypothetical protein
MGAVQLNSSRFTNDAPKEFINSAIVKRAGVHVLQSKENGTFAVRVAKRQVLRFLDRAYFQGESRAHVQKPQQFSVEFVDLVAPVLYIHHDNSAWVNKKTSRDF